jgi:hypothetical protein
MLYQRQIWDLLADVLKFGPFDTPRMWRLNGEIQNTQKYKEMI